MSSYNYNTENISTNIDSNTPYALPYSVDNAGYLAIQAGVSGTTYGTSTTGTDITNTLTALTDVNTAEFNSAVTLQYANPHVNNQFTYTVTAGNQIPANVSINLLDALHGNVAATMSYQVPNNDYLTVQYGQNSVEANQQTYLAYVNTNNNTYVVTQIGDNYVSFPDIVNLYNANSSNIPSPWDTASFWQNTTDPALQQFYNYFCMMNDDILGEPQGYSKAQGLTPPTSAISFFQDVLQKALIYTPEAGSEVANIGQYNGAAYTSGTAAYSALGSSPPAAIEPGQTVTSVPSINYYANLSAAPSAVTDISTQQLKSEFFNAFQDQYFSQPTNFSGITTPAELINSYLTFLGSPNTSIDLSALSLAPGTTIPFNLVAEGTGVSAQIGTYTIQNGDIAPLSPITVVPGLGTPTSQSASWTSISTQFTTALQSIFDTAYQSSGIANNPVIADVGETTLFNNTFSAFMTAISSGQLKPTSLQDIMNDWSSFVGPSVTLGTSALTSYQQIYDTFFPNGSTTNFNNMLNAFISQYLQGSGGVFNSSLMADQWYAAVQNSYLLANNLTVSNAQPLQQANFSEVKIIFSLYSLLINVLGDIQRLTASQAQYDNVLVQLEGAYTNEIAGIPDDLVGSTIPGGVNISTKLTSTQLQVQSSYESQISNATQKWISNITAFNTEVSNNEKNQTTTISQSNEASNQQSNLINSILQELQSLLQSIWR